jgi:hypothetical protein
MNKVVEKQLFDIIVGDVVEYYGKVLEKLSVAREGRFDVKFEDRTSLNIHGSTVWKVIVKDE